MLLLLTVTVSDRQGTLCYYALKSNLTPPPLSPELQKKPQKNKNRKENPPTQTTTDCEEKKKYKEKKKEKGDEEQEEEEEEEQEGTIKIPFELTCLCGKPGKF